MRTASHPLSPLPKSFLIALMTISYALCGSTDTLAQTLVIETPDGTPNDVGSYTSIALDALGNPNVSYHDNTATDLKYARKTGGVWTRETIVGFANAIGSYSSIALDAAGNPHISYHDATTGDLKYVTRPAGGSWLPETPDGSANVVGTHTSIALDASGAPHISYQDATLGTLKYVRKPASLWFRDTVDGVPEIVGSYTSLALDASGNPHVSYYEISGNLRYARKAGAVWTVEEVDASGSSLTWYTSLALDASGNPHVTYFVAGPGDLRYARKSGGVWAVEAVDSSPNSSGLYTSLVLDTRGDPHVSYYDASSNDLKYARKSQGVWTLETLDGSANDMGSYSALALDASGRAHVTYYDATSGDLKYAYIPSVRVASPQPGVTWAVGSEQTIKWYFTGGLPIDNSDVYLSFDGGTSFTQIRNEARDPEMTLRVPHSPTRFASIKIIRPSPYTEAYMDSFFTIDATIALAKFEATRGEDGTRLTWETRPGPEADISYRVERSAGGGFSTVADALDRGEFVDPSPAATSRYRLIAINGLGEEYVLGETSVTGALASGRDLSVQPNPARGGAITVLFRAPFDAASGGTSDSRAEVAVYDLSGRCIVTLAEGQRSSGVHTVTWDGRDDAGRDVAAGAYFARLSWNGVRRTTERVTIVR